MGNFDHHFERDEKNKDFIFERPREEVRISEVLQHNLLQLDKLSIAQQSTAHRNDNTDDQNDTIHKMQGDIPQLNLHKSFFVGGIRIGWPYPLIMPPQRQMVIHLTKAFKTSRHVVMESPTGTGKSAAILCAALAWQRYHSKVHQGEVTKIIYCSRTHSQVAQMVKSLKRTPYRPRMAILGSRDRLCIHEQMNPRSHVNAFHEDGGGGTAGRGNRRKQFKGNINMGCRIRTRNTDAYRKVSEWV